jgi:electron transport complex protein RnfC
MKGDPIELARQAGVQLHHFHGGLRLRHNKKISCETPIEKAPLATRYFVPLLQQNGQEAKPTVQEGQSVLKGDTLGRLGPQGDECIHAPTSGTVTAILTRPNSQPSGGEGRCIVIKPDGLDQWKTLHPISKWEQAEPATIQQSIRNSGIVGLGGAVFPTGVKIDEARLRGIHTLIINGSECEPYISCDEMLMRENPESIILGARILQRAIGASRTVIAIEDQMGVVNAALAEAVRQSGAENVDIVKVTTIYPEGGEKQLIQVLTGLEVPSGGRPTDLGLLCLNVATATAVAQAVTEGKPLIERIVTVTGNGVRKPRNLLAQVGIPVSNLIDLCGGYTPDAARLVLGGPMMGYALSSDSNPVVKAANCYLVLSSEDIEPAQTEMPCIRCGECARVCPSILLPQELNHSIRNGLWEETIDLGLADCIECGCCDFVCPSHIPLTSWFRFGKSELRVRDRERQQSDIARERFEARELRLDRIKQERKQRIAAKKRALSSVDEKQKKIAAARERVRSRQESKP